MQARVLCGADDRYVAADHVGLRFVFRGELKKTVPWDEISRVRVRGPMPPFAFAIFGSIGMFLMVLTGGVPEDFGVGMIRTAIWGVPPRRTPLTTMYAERRRGDHLSRAQARQLTDEINAAVQNPALRPAPPAPGL